ncbi:MAG: secretin N-terminal domain-containing protein [Kiritimatiellae bacterium]|nr:secretin N-terminal domain-containing protein [Kiritimatiellia bacterium]
MKRFAKLSFPAKSAPRAGMCVASRLLTLVCLCCALAARAANIEIGALDRVKVEAFAQLLSDAVGRPFAVAGDVDAAFTVIVPGGVPLQLPAEEVYAFGLSVLASAGLSVVEEGGSCRIVRLPEGGGLAVGAAAGEPASGLVTRVFRLEHAAADDVRRVLEGGGGRKGWISVLESSNHLVVTDTARTLDRVAVLVAELDQPGLSRVTEVVPLRFADAEALAAQLNTTVAEGVLRAGQQLASRLQGAPGAPAVSPAAARAGLAVPAPHANSLILVGPTAQIAEFKSLIAKLDVDTPTGRGHLNAIPLQYMKAEDAAKSISSLLEKSAAKAADGKSVRRIAVEASAANNALLVDATPNDFEIVRKLVEQLDRVPEQVQISVMIAEVADSSGFTWGVAFTALSRPGEEGETTLSGGTRLTPDPAGRTLVDDAAAGILPQGLHAAVAHATGTAADGSLIVGYPGIINIEALKSSGDVEILSETALQAQNNVEATVSIVDEIPILKSTIEGGSGTARDVIQNIERQEVGVKLKLMPHVIPGGLVRMQLNPSIESVISAGSSETEFTPTIAKRTANTTVTVPDGQTIVIAGLTRKDRQVVDNRIPILGDIPLLGWLFRYKSEVEKRANLLILVTPTIVAAPADAQKATQAWRTKTGITGDAAAPRQQ